jgi:hypothetical protein
MISRPTALVGRRSITVSFPPVLLQLRQQRRIRLRRDRTQPLVLVGELEMSKERRVVGQMGTQGDVSLIEAGGKWKGGKRRTASFSRSSVATRSRSSVPDMARARSRSFFFFRNRAAEWKKWSVSGEGEGERGTGKEERRRRAEEVLPERVVDGKGAKKGEGRWDREEGKKRLTTRLSIPPALVLLVFGSGHQLLRFRPPEGDVRCTQAPAPLPFVAAVKSSLFVVARRTRRLPRPRRPSSHSSVHSRRPTRRLAPSSRG